MLIPFVRVNRQFVRFHQLVSLLLASVFFCHSSYSSPSISAGIWMNYSYQTNSSSDQNTNGDVNSEALILYLDHTDKDSEWTLSSEVRWGPGAFTDSANNSSGDNTAIHKLWIARPLNDGVLTIGKSQVPFGWKTANFWAGDLLLGGYGDQMDVGIKYSATHAGGPLSYQAAYYHADDFGQTSTDTTDDNGHWGSATTFRKMQTFVGNIDYKLSDNHQVSFSAQSGKLQDLTSVDNKLSGHHHGLNLHYKGNFDSVYLKAQLFAVDRKLPDGSDVENTRAAMELGYSQDQYFYYVEASTADSDSNSVGMVGAHAVGMTYDYGPGWFYAEYLWQDGFIGRNGDTGAGNFSALYLTADYYF